MLLQEQEHTKEPASNSYAMCAKILSKSIPGKQNGLQPTDSVQVTHGQRQTLSNGCGFTDRTLLGPCISSHKLYSAFFPH